jgi:hypothetical protein
VAGEWLIAEPPPSNPPHQPVDASRVRELPCGVPVVELGEVAVQMFLRDVVVRPVDAALQLREVAFRSVRVRRATNEFVAIVVHPLVRGEPFTDRPVPAQPSVFKCEPEALT